MFALTEVEQPMPVGGGVKKLPLYVMNRDGNIITTSENHLSLIVSSL